MKRAWDLWGFKHTHICIIGVPEGEEREKGPEKIFEEIIAKNFPSIRNSQPSPGSIENLRQDKPKEEYMKTHGNQTDKKIKDKDKIVKAAREKQHTRELPSGYQLISQ